jgi:hypothetical protein
MIDTPEKYTIRSFERKAFLPYSGNKNNVMKHSFYPIKDTETDEEFTISFNGTDGWTISQGAWLTDSKTDKKSISSPENLKKWAVKETIPNSRIDVKATAENILKSIDNSDIKYWLNDGIFDYANYNNCNIALEETRVGK